MLIMQTRSFLVYRNLKILVWVLIHLLLFGIKGRLVNLTEFWLKKKISFKILSNNFPADKETKKKRLYKAMVDAMDFLFFFS